MHHSRRPVRKEHPGIVSICHVKFHARIMNGVSELSVRDILQCVEDHWDVRHTSHNVFTHFNLNHVRSTWGTKGHMLLHCGAQRDAKDCVRKTDGTMQWQPAAKRKRPKQKKVSTRSIASWRGTR